MEAEGSSETCVTSYKTTQRYNPMAIIWTIASTETQNVRQQQQQKSVFKNKSKSSPMLGYQSFVKIIFSHFKTF
jgi:hypothetical protein